MYPIRTVFYTMTKTENDYGEVLKDRVLSFSTGSRPITMSFKDKMQGEISLDGERQFLYVRKNSNTSTVKIGDHLDMPAVSPKMYEVIGIDQKLTDRRELIFLIDALEGN
jgi:hypothetical protein